MKRYSTQFERLPVGLVFSKNGNAYIKQSTKTAAIIAEGEPYHMKWYYFSKNDNVVICEHNIQYLEKWGLK